MSQTVWPLNENGEIVFSAGTGSGTVTGYLSQDVLPSADGGIPVIISNSPALDVVDAQNNVYLTNNKRKVLYRENSANLLLSDGFLTSSAGTGTRAWYGEYKLENVTRFGAEFKFTAGSGGKNGVINICPWRDSVTKTTNIPPTSAHLSISRWGWGLSKIETTNGPLVVYASGWFETPLNADEVYVCDVCIDKGVIYILLPDGSSLSVKNSVLYDINYDYAGFEFYQSNGSTDDLVAIRRFWASNGDQMLYGAAPIATALNQKQDNTVTAKQLTSITTSTIPTTAALLDSSAICSLNHGVQDNRVVCELTIWATLSASRSLIFAPRFVNLDGSQLSQPFIFACTSGSSGYTGYVTLKFIQNITSTQPVSCEWWLNSTGSGDTVTVSASKPAMMMFTPLGK